MLEWQEWTFPAGNILNEGGSVRLSPLFADWWGYSLTHLWWSMEGCDECAAEVERC